ncbi:hypothetical protein [Amycolatopsis sp. NPDC004169]|uniref:hypothetical protein n=1 Tax=Amycolatopsis sp. NPDC004169 TaxID=3154453 RepID=UPI0033BAABD5
MATGVDAPALPGMTALDVAAADVWATSIAPDRHPVQFVRKHLDELGVVPAAQVLDVADRSRNRVGGAVTHKQRSATAGGLVVAVAQRRGEHAPRARASAMSWWVVVSAAIVVAAVGWAATCWLLGKANHAGDPDLPLAKDQAPGNRRNP